MFRGVTLDDYLFTEEDYSTFEEKNWRSIHPDIMSRRHNVQKKLHSDFNIKLIPELHKRGYDLDLHPSILRNPRLEFSLDRPCEYNHNRVNWMGTRYGRKSEIEDLNWGITGDEDKIGFHKFTVFQAGVGEYGFSVGIFHAVPRDSIDRIRTRENIRDINWRNGFVEVLKTIQGYDLYWNVSNKGTDDPNDVEHNFYFDYQDINGFPEFYEKYDTDGSYSGLMYRFSKWDKRVLKTNIISSSLDIFDILYPVYDYIKWKRI